MAYHCWTTHLRTGEVLADNLPLHLASFSRTLGGTGELSATLSLRTPAAATAAHLAALEPRRSVLWVGEDGFPVWGGVVWDWPHASALDHVLPIRAATLESLFARREIRDDRAYVDEDVFDVARDLISNVTSWWPGKEVANLIQPEGLAGVRRTVSYLATDSTKALKALQDLAADAGFEWTLEPGLAGESAAFHLRMGCPQVGQGADAAALVLQMPGNVVDYAWPRTGGASVNSFTAVATATGEQGSQAVWRANATDQDDVDFGNPVLEDSASYAGTLIGGQAQLDGYAAALLARHRRCATVPTATVGGPGAPLLRELTLGSWAHLAVSSPLHPPDPATGAPGLRRLVRIVGWTANPGDGGGGAAVGLHLAEAED